MTRHDSCVKLVFAAFIITIAYGLASKTKGKPSTGKLWSTPKKGVPSIKLTHRNGKTFLATAYAKRNHIVRCCGRSNCQKSYDKYGKFGRNGSKRRNNSTRAEPSVERSDFNGPSSKLVKIGKTRYKFPKEKATFNDAKKVCAKDNMEISSFESQDERNKISEYLGYIGISDNPLFSTFASMMAGSSADSYTNWGMGSPPGGAGKCLVQQSGFYFNASCDQKINFACEEKKLPPGVTTTLGPDSLASIEDAVLSFVGGKNIIVPSERATKPEAESLCAKQGLSLLSLDSLAQLDSVQDFLGDIGLSTGTVMTAIKKVEGGGANWLGDLASALLPPKDPSQDGSCLGLNTIGLVGLNCDTVSNFVCQAPDPPGYTPPTMEPNFSQQTPSDSSFKGETSKEEVATPAPSDGAESELPISDSTQAANKETTLDNAVTPANVEGSASGQTSSSLTSSTLSSGSDLTSSSTLNSLGTLASNIITNILTTMSPANGLSTPASIILPGPTEASSTVTITSSTDNGKASATVVTTTSNSPLLDTTTSTPSPTTTISTSTSSSTSTSTSTTTTTTTSAPTLSAYNYTVGNKFTYFSGEMATCDEAEEKCRAMNLTLLTLDCQLEVDELNRNGPNDTVRAKTLYFVKNNSYAKENTQGTINASFPSTCIAFKKGGLWNAVCDQKSYYACENQVSLADSVCGKTGINVCRFNVSLHEIIIPVKTSFYGRYFVPIGLRLNHSDANNKCKSLDPDATLVKLDNPFEHSGELNTLLTGLNYEYAHVSIEKANSTNSEWLAWLQKFTDKNAVWYYGGSNYKYGYCVAAYRARLVSVHCNYTNPFVCERQLPVPKDYNLTMPSGISFRITGFPISSMDANNLCAQYGQLYANILQSEFHYVNEKMSNITELENPDIIAMGLEKRMGVWGWTRLGNVFNPTEFGWALTFTTPDNCAGIGRGQSAAVTYSCTQPRRILCE